MSSSTSNVLVISSDCHAGALPATYDELMPRKYREASAEWKLNKLIPGLNLQGLYLIGRGAVERAARMRVANPSLKVLPVIGAGEDAPEGPHAVTLNAEEFGARSSSVAYPVLAAARLSLKDVEATRKDVEGNYLVARVRVSRK